MRYLAALSIILFSAASLEAAGPFTLKEAVELGLRDNHGLRAAAASTGAAAEDVGVARGRLLPKITFEERYMRTDNPTFVFSSKLGQERFTAADFAIDSLNSPEAINDFQTSVSLEQLVYSRGAFVGLDMARQEYTARRDELDRQREQAAFEIAKAWLGVNTADGFVKAAEAGLSDSREHLRIAEQRHTAGLGLYSDVLRARTGLLSSEQRLVTARKEAELARRALGMLVGLDEEAWTAPSGFEMRLEGIDRYLASSLERSDLKSTARRSANAKSAVSLANSAYLPTIGVGGTYFMNDHESPFGSEGESWQVSAFLRWNIFDASRGHEAARARLKSTEAEEHLKGLRKSVSFAVRKAYLEVQEAEKNLELAEAALRSAEEGERLVRLRYENSLSPLVDLLDSGASLSAARASLVMRKNAHAQSLAALSFEGGTILEDLGVK